MTLPVRCKQFTGTLVTVGSGRRSGARGAEGDLTVAAAAASPVLFSLRREKRSPGSAGRLKEEAPLRVLLLPREFKVGPAGSDAPVKEERGPPFLPPLPTRLLSPLAPLSLDGRKDTDCWDFPGGRGGEVSCRRVFLIHPLNGNTQGVFLGGGKFFLSLSLQIPVSLTRVKWGRGGC